MSERIKCAIIGGGVIGCAIAYQLSKKYDEIFVFEKNDKIKAENQSSRNSGVIHAGVYYPKDLSPLKAELCVKGNYQLYEFCKEFDVPYSMVGKLILAQEQQEIDYLEDTFQIAQENQVPDCRMVSMEEAKQMEPNISCIQAAYFPTSGVVEATNLVYQLYTLAVKKDVFFFTGTKVINIEAKKSLFEVTTESKNHRETFETEVLINAAGLYSDELARMINPDFPYTIVPYRGEAAKFYKNKRDDLFHAGLNVYPTPMPLSPDGKRTLLPIDEFKDLFKQGKILKTVGVHLTPVIDFENGRRSLSNVVTLGPSSKVVGDKEDYSKELFPEQHYLEQIRKIFPNLLPEDISLHQAGIQAKLKGQFDWIIEPDDKYPNCIHLVGVDSPGLTSCLAIADYVNDMYSGIL